MEDGGYGLREERMAEKIEDEFEYANSEEGRYEKKEEI